NSPRPIFPPLYRDAGELSNGMEYYVRANRHPRERAELRIAIKV
ncbi:unnamed protein product, partial [Scytosiphon promiscuus]